VGGRPIRKQADLDQWLLGSTSVADLEFSDTDRTIIESCFVSPLVIRSRARSAMFHIRRAWDIREVDPEMAAFRAITAEEESVTAIFKSVQRRNYTGAKRLRPYDHVQKSALAPFLVAVENALAAALPGQNVSLETYPGKPKTALRLKILGIGPDGRTGWWYPVPPLNFTMGVDGKPHNFEEELQVVRNSTNTRSILDHVRDLANRRNRIIYASDLGIPQWDGNIDGFIRGKKAQVMRNLTILLFIDQSRERQQFVQQVMDAFLSMLPRLPAKP